MDIPRARLDALLDERRLLHAEKLDMERGVQRSVLGFISVGAAAAGLYFNHAIVTDSATRERLVLLLTQVEVVLALLVVAFFTLIVTIAGYLQAVEGQINEIVGRPTNIWESRIVGATFWNRRGAGLWGASAVVLFFVGSFAFLLFMVWPTLWGTWGILGIAVEVLVTFALAIWAFRMAGKVARIARHEFDRQTPGRRKRPFYRPRTARIT